MPTNQCSGWFKFGVGMTNTFVVSAMGKLYTFLRQEEAATAVEYAVMLALIVAVLVGTLTSFGLQEGEGWNRIDNQLTSHGVGS